MTFRGVLDAEEQGLPLYQQLYNFFQKAILSGELQPGSKLPASRDLAGTLHIARNTVVNAYRQLETEGYLEIRAGSGTFVAQVLPELLLSPSQPDTAVRDRDESVGRLSERSRAQLAISQISIPALAAGARQLRPFSPDLPALDVFPFKLWSRLVVQQARHMPAGAYASQDWAGYLPLRQAIAAHIAVARRVQCTPEQILITSGSQGALDLAARLLVNAGDPVWVEDPGYHGARGALLGAGAQLIPVPVDDQGLEVETAIARAPHARLVYLTPSHQYPLGVTLSLPRRLALLEWARETGAFVLEDDYDSEFRFAGRPLAALQGLDRAGRVIYIGTFSKVLFPALRLGYLVLPPALLEAFLAVRRFSDVHPPALEQAVLAEFLTGGHFARHVRRMRTIYAGRRAALLAAFEALPLELDAPEAGIHCVGWLPAGMDARRLARVGSQHGLDLTPVTNYCLEPLDRQGLLLGYGGYDPLAIQAGAQRLAAALADLR